MSIPAKYTYKYVVKERQERLYLIRKGDKHNIWGLSWGRLVSPDNRNWNKEFQVAIVKELETVESTEERRAYFRLGVFCIQFDDMIRAAAAFETLKFFIKTYVRTGKVLPPDETADMKGTFMFWSKVLQETSQGAKNGG